MRDLARSLNVARSLGGGHVTARRTASSPGKGALFGYNLDYARDILDADRTAFLRFAQLGALKRCRSKTTDTGSGHFQLMVSMALHDGVAPATIAAVLRGDEAELDDSVRLGARFARATLAHDPAADELRDEILRRWGPRAVVSLAFGIAAARLFPTIEYALGHGRACQRVDVAGETIAPGALAAPA